MAEHKHMIKVLHGGWRCVDCGATSQPPPACSHVTIAKWTGFAWECSACRSAGPSLHISDEEAEEIRKRYFQRYPKAAHYWAPEYDPNVIEGESTPVQTDPSRLLP